MKIFFAFLLFELGSCNLLRVFGIEKISDIPAIESFFGLKDTCKFVFLNNLKLIFSKQKLSDTDIHDECLTICRLQYMDCLAACDDSTLCQSQCRVEFGCELKLSYLSFNKFKACEGSCPCGIACPAGCDGCDHPLCNKCDDAQHQNPNYKSCVLSALNSQVVCRN